MKMKNQKSFCSICISLLASAVSASAAGVLNGDTTVKKQLPEFGNFSIEGTDFKMGLETLPGTVGNGGSSYSGGSPGNEFNNGQLTIKSVPSLSSYSGFPYTYGNPKGYKTNVFFSAESCQTNWTWSQLDKVKSSYNNYLGVTNNQESMMQLSSDNILSIYRKSRYDPSIVQQTSGSFYINNEPKIILDPGTGYAAFTSYYDVRRTENARILVGGNEVVTAANASSLLSTALANNYASLSPTQSFVVTGTTGGTANPPASGAGTRMMWYTEKGAFRAGSVTGNLWDKALIGGNSAAFGYNTTASGAYSTASGSSTKATGISSFASGATSIASGLNSTAMGTSTAAGINSTALGNSWATGSYSSSLGQSTASNFCSTCLGQNNEMRTGGTGATAWAANNQNSVLEVGIGLNTTSRKNALTVLQDGSVEIGKATTTDNSVPLIVKSDGTVILSKAQGDISMGIYQ
jgi:hypothetical protein